MALKIEYVKTDELVPYGNNAKLHPADQIEQIKKSIEEFGFNDPIAVWHGNEIIEGHGRLIAASELGIEKVPIVRLDDLTDDQRKAYMLAHNKLTMNSGFDEDILAMELDSISFDMSEFGFSIGEDQEEPKEKGEVPFTEVLGEENNYIVLQFKTDIDWLNAVTLFGIKQAQALSTRKDGKITSQHIGVGRVLDGAKVLDRIMGEDR